MLKIMIQLFAEGDPQQTPGIEKNYLEEITALKKQMETMVPGAEYDRVLEEHKRLTNEYINKRPAPVEEKVEPRKASDIITDMSKATRKVDHVKLSLEYREAFIKENGNDPWVGSDVSEEEAEQVAEHYKGLLEAYGDDPAEFTYRFDQSLQNDPTVEMALKAKKKK